MEIISSGYYYDYYDNDYGATTMTTVHRKQITDLMTKVIPMTEPNLLYLQSFRKKLSTTLFIQKARGKLTGHAWLVESATGDLKAVLPTRPQEPIEPTGSPVSTTAYRAWETTTIAYETVEHWDQEIIKVLQIKFPTGLTDLEIEDGMLPLSLTGRIAFDHIEKKVISHVVSTKAYLELVKDVTGRTYEPNGSGPE